MRGVTGARWFCSTTGRALKQLSSTPRPSGLTSQIRTKGSLTTVVYPRPLVVGRREAMGLGLLLGPVTTLASAVDPACSTVSVVEPNEVIGKDSNEIDLGSDEPYLRVQATGRIVAIGDLHGDWQKAIDALLTAKVIELGDDDTVIWVGGDTTVVQCGDVLDRGDNEIAIVKLLRALDDQARLTGGAVYMINGNHESLNVCGDFRYVTPGAFIESALYAGLSEDELDDWGLLARVRYAVYKPGGPMAMELAKNPTVLIVNDTVFAHGGLLPQHVSYGLAKLNAETAAWMRADTTPDGGKAAPPFLAMGDSSSVFWHRGQSKESFTSPLDRFNVCNKLGATLKKIGAKRLVVGHTPQLQGANCECDGKVWRVDVGMSSGVLNRVAQVLEIKADQPGEEPVVTVLSRASDNLPSFHPTYGV